MDSYQRETILRSKDYMAECIKEFFLDDFYFSPYTEHKFQIEAKYLSDAKDQK